MLVVYNEENLLPGALESLLQVVDRIVVVDGAYRQFPHPEGIFHSTDATLEIVRCYGAELIECPPTGWPNERIKRSAYLRGEEGDWYLHLDADERLRGELPALEEEASGQSYKLQVIWSLGTFRTWAARLFQHRGRMRYRGAHCALFSDQRLISRPREAIPIWSAWLAHLKGCRDPERVTAKAAYVAWQSPAEREFRTRWEI